MSYPQHSGFTIFFLEARTDDSIIFLLTKTVLVEKYFQKLTTDFQINKKVASDVSIMPSKRVRNKVAGYVTVLMKRIQRGPVRGISLKLQEEERERKLDFVPEVSALDREYKIMVNPETESMLSQMGMADLKRVHSETREQQRGDRRREKGRN
jgi:small subunit ribosomal protein S17e